MTGLQLFTFKPAKHTQYLCVQIDHKLIIDRQIVINKCTMLLS